ncbi:cyclase family protein [Aureibacter tunicatorum]|uniref:Kynurenine formamidase n=1 Tax=Aureibacter tunicatorum TaxID=866807 RepID=A0AAE3XRN9_9BACT|nr:cyclase family protein [Aureibacter tunicatorum]MDR6240818.1 kynurenine formamidase [Aureibacter tunicatorum]BDD06849.1 cyclase [Aureibacter tunicatorum]
MIEIIDLSQEIYEGMPVFKDLPQVKMNIHNSHEEWGGEVNPKKKTPAVHKLELGEHTGTHVDALNHMSKEYEGQSIDTMPLSLFYTEGICLDFSHKGLNELIEIHEIQNACEQMNLVIEKGDTVLFYTDHYRKHYDSENWPFGPGLSAEAVRWLGEKEVSAFGVETMSPGVRKVSNREAHLICGEMGFTHYENLINLHELIGKGRFRFIGFPLKIRGGTGSPVRAVAVFDGI